MAFKINPIYGTLDLVSGSSSSGVTGVAPTTVNAIARWNDTAGTSIKDSPGTLVQDGGGIQAQAFLTNRVITELVTIAPNFSMLASNIEIEDGEIVIDTDAELVII